MIQSQVLVQGPTWPQNTKHLFCFEKSKEYEKRIDEQTDWTVDIWIWIGLFLTCHGYINRMGL